MSNANENRNQFAAIAGLIDIDVLANKRVTIIGLGRMGQPVVEQLVRHGVGMGPHGRLRLIDGDRIEPRNIVGTGYRASHVGMLKTEAMANIITEILGESKA